MRIAQTNEKSKMDIHMYVHVCKCTLLSEYRVKTFIVGENFQTTYMTNVYITHAIHLYLFLTVYSTRIKGSLAFIVPMQRM